VRRSCGRTSRHRGRPEHWHTLITDNDRWADLAIATWSAGWNYGPGWERPLLDAYGVPPDPDRTRYYRLLWDLGP